MSRLGLVSWLTSATVHSGVLALLGTMLTSLPVRQAEIAGNRVVVSSTFSPPAPAEPVTQTKPVDLAVQHVAPSADPQVVDRSATAVAEALELRGEPPEPPRPFPKPLDLDELRDVSDPILLPTERSRLQRTRPAQFAAVPPTPRREKAVETPPRSEPSPPPVQTTRRPFVELQPLPRAVELPPIPRAIPAAPPKAVVEAAEPPAPRATPQTAGTTETTPARALDNPKPVYPPDAVRKQLEGVVVLRVTITASGKVSRVTIASSSGHEQLDRAARDAVLNWEFAPALRGGVPVDWTARLPVRFRL